MAVRNANIMAARGISGISYRDLRLILPSCCRCYTNSPYINEEQKEFGADNGQSLGPRGMDKMVHSPYKSSSDRWLMIADSNGKGPDYNRGYSCPEFEVPLRLLRRTMATRC